MIENVEELLKTHGIKYQKRGNVIKCLCPNPDHDDTNIGSFSYNEEKQLGYCFACGYSCNIFSLNKLLGEKYKFNSGYNFSFNKSLKPKKEEIVYPTPHVYGKLYSARYSKKVMDFLHGIGFSDEFIDLKEIKYCTYCEMIAENLISNLKEKPTVMKERICIPIYKDGKLVNYECRTFVGEEPKVKYVNGCKSNLIFNIDSIDINKDVILTESIKNLAKGWNVNHNIISTFGNQITEVKLEMLNKIPSIILFADNDEGGLFMLKKLKEGYHGKLRVTFNPKKYRDKEGNLKGYDMNDCSLEEIKNYLNNTMNVERAEERLSSFEEDNIMWY